MVRAHAQSFHNHFTEFIDGRCCRFVFLTKTAKAQQTKQTSILLYIQQAIPKMKRLRSILRFFYADTEHSTLIHTHNFLDFGFKRSKQTVFEWPDTHVRLATWLLPTPHICLGGFKACHTVDGPAKSCTKRLVFQHVESTESDKPPINWCRISQPFTGSWDFTIRPPALAAKFMSGPGPWCRDVRFWFVPPWLVNIWIMVLNTVFCSNCDPK